MEDETLKASYLPQLDALRGLACLMVLLAHANTIGILGWIPDVVGPAGVALFFALSGFLITRILLVARTTGRDLIGFYARRVARIFPIYYLTLAVLWFVHPTREIRWAADFSFNWRYLADSHDYFRNTADAAPEVAHFWSLCVEEHFYWIWPIAVMTLPPVVFRKVPAMLIVATPFAADHLFKRLFDAGFTSADGAGLISRISLTQFTAISIGSLAAIHEAWLFAPILRIPRMRRSAGIGLALMLAALVVLMIARSGFVSQDAIATYALHLFCGGLFVAALPIRILERIPLLSRIGTISYGAYLFHLPIYAALGITGVAASTGRALMAISATLTLAAISFRAIERPILTRVRYLRTNRSGAAFGVVLTGLVFGFAVYDALRDYRNLDYVRGADGPAVAPEAVRQIIVGSSHEDMGIAPALMDDCTYNLAFLSQDLWYDCAIAEQMAERLPNLRRVVFGISYFSPWYSIADDERQRWRHPLYANVWNISPPRSSDDPALYTLLAVDDELAFRRLTWKRMLLDEPERGRYVPSAGKFDPQAAERTAMGHRSAFLSGTNIEEPRNRLIAAIEKLKRHQVGSLLITTPTHPLYKARIDSDHVDAFRQFVAEVKQATGAKHLDYSTDVRFDKDVDFYDGDHLSEIGSDKFSKILAADLKQVR